MPGETPDIISEIEQMTRNLPRRHHVQDTLVSLQVQYLQTVEQVQLEARDEYEEEIGNRIRVLYALPASDAGRRARGGGAVRAAGGERRGGPGGAGVAAGGGQEVGGMGTRWINGNAAEAGLFAWRKHNP